MADTTTEATPAAPTAPQFEAVDDGKGGVQFVTPDLKAELDKNVETPATDARPAALPEKFKSVDDLAKAYVELEKAFTKSRQEAPKTETKTEAPADPAAPATEAGMDLAALEAEAASGELSAETYAKMAAKGFDKAATDSIIEGRRALAERQLDDLATVAGGREELKSVLAWAGKELPKAQVDAYQSALSTGNADLVKLALSGIVSAFRTANPSEPTKVSGVPAGVQGSDVKPFASNAQLVAAMRDPRYAIDPAYRADVAKRLAASNGVNF